MRLFLRLLRSLILFKRYSLRFLPFLGRPFLVFFHGLFRHIGVPLFRVFFYFRRHLGRLLRPAKRRVLFIFTNRLILHVMIVGLVVATGVANIGRGTLRAESFGQKSLLYQTVSKEDFNAVSIVTASQAPARQEQIKKEDATIDVTAHIDFDYLGEAYVAPGPLAEGVLPQEPEPTFIPTRETTQEYVVQDGDSLWTIASAHGLNVSTVLWANNLSAQSLIRPGQKLVVPPVDGVLYKVKRGDTLAKIAKQFSVSAEEIERFNKLASADDLQISEELVIPGGKITAPVVRRTAPVAKIFTGNTQTKGSGAGRGSWVWPTNWRVITQYYGWRHTGLDIDGDYSTQSFAAAPGVVIFVGWKGGYGLTVEMDHGDGFKTRYAHHTKVYVKKGDVMQAGDPLAQTGTTGRSTGTHLHFEVIKNGKFQNPLDYIR